MNIAMYILFSRKKSENPFTPYKVFFPTANKNPNISGTTFERAKDNAIEFLCSEDSTGIIEAANPKTVLKTLGTNLNVLHFNDLDVNKATFFHINKGAYSNSYYGPLSQPMESQDWEHDNATKRFLGFIRDPAVIDDHAKQVIIVDFINAWQDYTAISNIILNEILDICMKENKYLEFVNTGVDLIHKPWEEDNIFTYFLRLARRKTDTEKDKIFLKRIAHIIDVIKEIDKITNKQTSLLSLMTWKLEFFEGDSYYEKNITNYPIILREIRYAINNGFPMPQKRR